MKHCFRITNIIVALSALSAIAASALTGCKREGDPTLGFEFLPGSERLEMRHMSLRAGNIRRYDPVQDEYVESAGHNFFTTTHFRTDSLVSSNLQTGYMGIQRDPEGIFGLREAGFASEFLATTNSLGQYVDPKNGFGYLPIFDSMRIMLSVNSCDGDTLRPIRYEVFEVTKSIKQSMSDAHEKGDTIAYINHDMSDLYDASRPLFTFTFPDPENGIYTSQKAVTMTPADMNGATWDFVKRLMLVGDLNDGWDGYANDTDIYFDDNKWIESFNGLYIKPADELEEGAEGGMYATDLSASGLHLYARNRNPEEPRLIKDTLNIDYLFYDTRVVTAGNQSINYVKHDYSGSLLEALNDIDDTKRQDGDDLLVWRENNRRNHVESASVYVEGMGGAVTELHFTDDFLRELRNISAGEGFSLASVNQALMYIYLEGSDYDWANVTPELTPLLDSSLPRLGLYTSLETLSSVPDYNYYYEATYGTSLNYDGYLKRSLGCYVLDISSYIQRLKNYVDALNPEADDNFGYEFKNADDNSISRTLYIAPEAYSLYSLQRSKLQGMEDALNNASIRLELTYTMIK